MKQLFIILLSLLIFQIKSNGQNVFPATGNVGISNSSPLSLLDIGTTTRSSFSGGNSVFGPFQIRISSTSPTNSSIAAYIYNQQTVAGSTVEGIYGWVNSTNLTGTTTRQATAIAASTEHSGAGTLTWARAFDASGFLSSTGVPIINKHR